MEDGAQPDTPRRIWFRPSIVRLVLLVVLLAANVHYVNRTLDDAFIFFRYAENIARGKGWVFTEGERVEAYTSFLWTALLAFGGVLGAVKTKMGLIVVSKLGGIVFELGTVWCVADTARLVSPRTRNPCRGVFAVAVLALSAPFAFWSVSGLETPLAALLGTLAVHFQLRDRLVEPQRAVWPRSALLFALGVLTRPEIFFMFLVSACFQLSLELKARALRANLRSNWLWLGAFAAPCVAHLLWRHWYYGQWLPNTYYAKVAGDPLTWARGTTYVASALADLGLGGCLVAALIPFVFARRVPVQVVYLLALTSVQLLVIALEGGDWMPAFRFVVPILPVVALLADAGLNEAFDRWATRPGRGLTALAACVALGLLSYWGLRSIPASPAPSGFRRWQLVPVEQAQVAQWMNEHLPHRGLLAIAEAGIIPYFTELPVLDLFGLADRHIAHLPGIRHQKFDVEYVLKRAPEYVLFYGKDKHGNPAPVFTYSKELLSSPRFIRQYRVLHDFRAFTLYERSARDSG
jgi:arabinofuranosyltransferase